MVHADLSPSHLLRSAWSAFERRPAIAIGMWVVAALFDTWGGAEGDGVFASLVTLAAVLLSGPIQGGFDYAMLRLLRGDESLLFSDLFAGLEKFGNLFVVFLLSTIAILAGFVLLIVPGIIAGLALWPAYLLVMEDDLSPMEALRAAWELTDGHKLDLFLLSIVSLVLYLAGALAFGIGVLVTGPIVQLAWITAYEEIRNGDEPSDIRRVYGLD